MFFDFLLGIFLLISAMGIFIAAVAIIYFADYLGVFAREISKFIAGK